MDTLKHTQGIASSIVAFVKAQNDQGKALETVNLHVKALRAAKVVIGRVGICLHATALRDGIVEGLKVKPKVATNYITTVRWAVETGKPITGWNKSREVSKGTKGKKVKGKAGKAGSTKSFIDLFVPVFNHDGGKTFMALCKLWQDAYDDAQEMTIYDAVKTYLVSEDCDITE